MPDADDMAMTIARIEFSARELLRRLPPRAAKGSALGRPFVVEFAGAPRAGKTSALDHMSSVLRRHGFRVDTVSEDARSSRVRDKRDPLFNLSTAMATGDQIIQATHGDDTSHLLLVDRGFFDALCWQDWLLGVGAITRDEHDDNVAFLQQPRLCELTDLVFVLTVAPERALERDLAGRVTRRSGPIMNMEALQLVNNSIARVMKHQDGRFQCVHLDTTHSDQISILARMTFTVLKAMDDSIDRPLSREVDERHFAK